VFKKNKINRAIPIEKKFFKKNLWKRKHNWIWDKKCCYS